MKRKGEWLCLCVLLFLTVLVSKAQAQLNCGAADIRNKIFQELGTTNLYVGVNAATALEDSLCPTTARVEVWVVGVGNADAQTARPTAAIYIGRPVQYPGTYQSKSNHWVIWYPGTPLEHWQTAGNTQDQCEVVPRGDPPPDPCAGGWCPTPEYACEGEYLVADGCGCPLCFSPIFVQVGGGRTEFSSPQQGVLFDLFGTKRMNRLSWPVSAGTAWLVIDRNQNGIIDDGTELFGNTRWLAAGRFARDGYEVLAELDENGDGVIDVSDSAFGALRLWEDRNRDGRSDESELMTLSEAGIQALELEVRESRHTDRWGNRFRYRAKVESSIPPRQNFSYDVFLTAEGTGSAPSACSAGGAIKPTSVPILR